MLRSSSTPAAAVGSALYATMQRWATAMRDLGTPILFVFDHEPEAVSGGGTQAQYIAAYRNFAGVVASVGATNVENIWIMTANAFKVGSRDRRQAVKWYPGDDVVDVIEEELYHVGRHEKVNLLLGLLQREQPKRAMVFVNRKVDVVSLPAAAE